MAQNPYPECESCYDLWCQLRDAKEALARHTICNGKLVGALRLIAAYEDKPVEHRDFLAAIDWGGCVIATMRSIAK